ncbi:MAG: AbrB family transcriptional regulator [Pseudomonadota bacterium]
MTTKSNAAGPAIIALGIGVCGAFFAYWISFPAPWLTGPAAFVTIAGLLGVNVGLPEHLRDAAFIVIGMSIGSGVTPETVASAAKWPLALFILAIVLIAIMAASTWILVRIFRFSLSDAMLAATPGHLSFVLSLGFEAKGDLARISIVQSVRVLALTLLVPLLYVAFGGSDLPEQQPRGADMALGFLLLTGALGLVFGIGLKRLQIPAALLLSGVGASVFMHVTDIAPGAIPEWLSIPAFILMGTLIGTRFRGRSSPELRSGLAAALTVTAIAALFAGIGALLVQQFIDMPLIHILVAFAPGGLEAMIAMGFILNANPAFVAVHHVARLTFLTLLVPTLLARLQKLEGDQRHGA